MSYPYNIVTWTPTDEDGNPVMVDEAGQPAEEGGVRVIVPVLLEGEFSQKAGLDPDVNPVVINRGNYRKLTYIPPGQTDAQFLSEFGWLEFWSEVDPLAVMASLEPVLPEPDVRIARVYIAEVQRLDPGAPSDMNVRYRLHLADCRWRWRPPFGGCLRVGPLNEAPLDVAAGKDAGGRDLKSTAELIETCLSAMGVTPPTPLIEGMDTALLPPIEDLKWSGSSAVEELKKLLDHIGAIAVPTLAGGIEIYAEGTGDGLITDSWDVSLFSDTPRRASQAVIVTSAPNAILETSTITGIGSGPVNPAEALRWEYCFYSPTLKKWVGLVDAGTDLGSYISFENAIRGEYADAPAELRLLLANQVGYCVRLIQPQGGAGPILRPRRGDGQSQPAIAPIEVMAKVMTQAPNGTWSNSTAYVQLPVEQIADCGRVLVLGYQLTKLEPGGTNPIQHAKELTATDLKIRCTRERVTTAGQPAFFEVGYRRSAAGTIVALTAPELAAAAGDPATIVVSVPEMVLRVIDGVEIGKTALLAKAEEIAGRWLQTRSTAGTATARRWVPAFLTGRVSEVRWSQQTHSTSIQIDAYSRPLYYKRAKRNSKRYGSSGVYYTEADAHPHQLRLAGQRSATNGLGSEQPVQVIGTSRRTAPAPAAASPLPTPSARYQVLQVISFTNSTTYAIGWDFPVAHP